MTNIQDIINSKIKEKENLRKKIVEKEQSEYTPYIERMGKTGLDIYEDWKTISDRINNEYMPEIDALAEERKRLYSEGKYSEGVEKELQGLVKKFGLFNDLVYSNAGSAVRLSVAPITPAIEDLATTAVAKTGGEEGIVGKAIEYGQDFSKGIEENITQRLLGVKPSGSEMATEGLLATLGGASESNSIIRNATKKVTSAITSPIKSAYKATTRGIASISEKFDSKYSYLNKGYDELNQIERNLIDDDLTNSQEIGDKSLDEGIKLGIAESISAMDKYKTALSTIDKSKTLDEAVDILNALGQGDENIYKISKFINDNKNEIKYTEGVRKNIEELEAIQDLKYGDKAYNDNIKAGQTDKIDKINYLLEQGALKFNGVDDKGNYSFLYEEDFKKKFKVGKKGVHYPKEDFDNYIGKTPDAINTETDIDKVIRVLKGNDLKTRRVNEIIDRIIKGDENVTDEYDLISTLYKINDDKRLGIDRKVIDDIYDPISGEINKSKLYDLQKEINKRNKEFFFGNENILGVELKNLKQKLRVEKKIIDGAYSAGAKEGKEAAKKVFKEKEIKINNAHKEAIRKLNERKNAKIKSLEEDLKNGKIKSREQLNNMKRKLEAQYNKKIEGIRNRLNTRIEELKSSMKGSVAVHRWVRKQLINIKNNKSFLGKIPSGDRVARILSDVTTKQKAEAAVAILMKDLAASHREGVIKRIGEILKIEKSFSKNNTRAVRGVYDLKKYLTFKDEIDKLRRFELKDLPTEMLENTLNFLETAVEETKFAAKRAKNANNRIVAIRQITEQSGGKMELYGDVAQGKILDTEKYGKGAIIHHYKTANKLLARVLNYPLKLAHRVNKIFMNSEIGRKLFWGDTLEVYNKFLLDFKGIEKTWNDISDVLGTEYNRNTFALVTTIMRRLDLGDGNYRWEGAEAIISELYGNKFDKFGNRMLREGVGYEPSPGYIPEFEPPIELGDFPQDLRDKISNTSFGERITKFMRDDELMEAVDDYFDMARYIGEKVKKTAINDGILFKQREYYVPLRNINGKTPEETSLLDYNGDFNSGVYDGMLGPVNIPDGARYDFSFKNMFFSSKKQLYYSHMNEHYKLLKDIYYGHNLGGIKSKKALLPGEEFSSIRGGLKENMGEYAQRAIEDILDAIAYGGIKRTSNGFDDLLRGMTWFSGGAAMSFKLSTVVKQTLSLIDATHRVGFDNQVWATRKLFNEDIFNRMLSKSGPLANREGGYNFIKDLQDSSKLLSGNKVILSVRQLIEAGLKPMQIIDKRIAGHTWLSAYRKYMKDNYPNISEDEILLMNNNKAINFANQQMSEIMNIADDIFASPLMSSATGKLLLNLTDTLQNRFGMFVNDFYSAAEKEGMIQAIIQNKWFFISNLAEAAITYELAKLYFEGGLSGFDPDNTTKEGLIKYVLGNDLLVSGVEAQLNSIPLVGLINNGIENEKFALLGPISYILDTYQSAAKLLDDKDDNDIQALTKIYQKFGLGDIPKVVNAMSNDKELMYVVGAATTGFLLKDYYKEILKGKEIKVNGNSDVNFYDEGAEGFELINLRKNLIEFLKKGGKIEEGEEGFEYYEFKTDEKGLEQIISDGYIENINSSSKGNITIRFKKSETSNSSNVGVENFTQIKKD